ncbi:MAG: SpoIIE family protein phosphatase, partial [Bacteroidales bacterium]|nr:SpoIIE family protein phosphatase [Bacteroidales bacterium]
MLIGSTSNGMIFDGIHWNSISKITFPRIFFNDTSSNTVYFGGDGSFGAIQFDSIGKPVVSLFSDSLKGNDKDFYTILSIVKQEDKIYFVGLKRIFIFQNDILITSIGSETDYRFAFTPENNFFIRQTNVGLMAVSGDSLIKVPQSELFGNEAIYFITPYDSVHYLIGAKTLGFFLFDKDYKNSQRVFTPLTNEVTPFLKNNKIGNGIILNDGRLAIGTQLGGVIILNKDLSPYLFFNERQGLVNNGVNNIFQDKENNLWILTNNGFSILYYGRSINKFYKRITGSKFLTVTLDIYKNQLFAGTMGGITKFWFEDYQTAQIPQNFISISENNDLKTQALFITHSGNNFMASTRDGVFYFNPSSPLQLIDSNQLNFTGHFSRFDSSYFFNGSLYGVDVFHQQNGKWINMGRIPLKNEVRNIAEEKKGILFVSSQRAGVYKITIPDYSNPAEYQIVLYDTTKGIKGLGSPNVFFYKNRILAFANNKILQLNEDSNIFKNITNELVRFVDDADTSAIPYKLTSDYLKSGNHYFGPNNRGNISEVLVTDSFFYISNYPFRNITSTSYFQTIDDTTRKCIWFTGPSGLYNYYYNQSQEEKPFSAFIYRVSIGKDSAIAFNNIPKAIKPLPYQFNAIRFDFSALFFENSEKTTYSYFLKGFDKQWSNLTDESFTKYTNLPFGTYTFMVKAINVYGDESLPASFSFTILAPWYMKWWAFIIYVVIVVFFVRLLIFLNVKRLKAVNIKLEKIVDERTAEIKEKNLELEGKNELITNSINYAKKIQDAIIPSETTLQKRFPESFLYFVPRDIVSGDFFWMYAINDYETIIALADCTGHGVPGAFMSMIGNTSLNEIVKEKKIFDPGEILQKLHMGIVNALQTHNESEVTEDGMDIIVCKINTKEKKITIAGANQNAFLYTDDNFVDFSATILSIGDPFAKKQEVVFENNQFSYTNSFKLYL